MSIKTAILNVLSAARRVLAYVVSGALVAMVVPVVGHIAEERDEKIIAEAYAASNQVLTAKVPSELGGVGKVDMMFTITGDNTCAVGRSNTSGGTSYAVAQSYDGSIVIPEEVEYADSSGEEISYTVTSIQPYAFGNGSEAESCACASIVVPYTVTTIDSYAFVYCEQLEEVTFSSNGGYPSELEEIGKFSFRGSGIESICLPNSVVTIGESAFRDCVSLTTVDFEDPEESKLEYLAGTSSGQQSSGGYIPGYTFSCEQDNLGSLESITIPAGVQSIPDGCFEYQEDLVQVEFLGESLNYIGSNAFNGCSSIVELTIPRTNVSSLGALASLTTLIFLGDGGSVDTSSMPSLETVVYWGAPSGGEGNESGGIDYYYNVEFYRNESDAKSETGEVASARILGGMTFGELRDVLYGNAEFEDGDVYDDGGAIPEDSEDYYWAFEEGCIDSDVIRGNPKSWRYDKSSDAINIGACRISLATTTFTRATKTIDLTSEYEILAPDGSEMPEGSYRVYAVLAISPDWRDIDGETTYVTYDDVSALTEEGDYELYFEAVEGSGYTGTTHTSFTIITTDIDFYTYPGEEKWAYTFADSVYSRCGEYENVVVVSAGDVYGAMAAQWVSPAADAAFLALPEDTVPDTNTDNWFNAAINHLLGENVGSVYVIGDESAISDEAFESIEQTVEVSNGSDVQRLSYSDEDAPARVWRMFSQDYESGATAYVAVGGGALAAAATELAYGDACPVFSCEENGELDPYTRFVLKTGHFDEIMAVGGDEAVVEQLEYQIGSDAMCSFEEGEAQDIALSVADDYYASRENATEMTALLASVDEGDEVYAVMGAVVASIEDGALFLAGSESEVEEAIPESYLGEDVAARTERMAFLGESAFLNEAEVYMSSLWEIDEEDEDDE